MIDGPIRTLKWGLAIKLSHLCVYSVKCNFNSTNLFSTLFPRYAGYERVTQWSGGFKIASPGQIPPFPPGFKPVGLVLLLQEWNPTLTPPAAAPRRIRTDATARHIKRFLAI